MFYSNSCAFSHSMLSSMLSLLVHAAIPLEGASSSQPLCAVGDLHGDPDHALRALRLCGAVDLSGRWSGGAMTVVQVSLTHTHSSPYATPHSPPHIIEISSFSSCSLATCSIGATRRSR